MSDFRQLQVVNVAQWKLWRFLFDIMAVFAVHANIHFSVIQTLAGNQGTNLHTLQVLLLGLAKLLSVDPLNVAAQPVVKVLLMFNMWGGYGAETSVAQAILILLSTHVEWNLSLGIELVNLLSMIVLFLVVLAVDQELNGWIDLTDYAF